MTKELGTWFLEVLKSVNPGATESGILNLDFQNDGLLFLTVAVLQFSWSKRIAAKKAAVVDFKAHLNAVLKIMSATRHKDIGGKVQSLVSSYP